MTRVSKCALWGLPRRPGLTECHPPLLRAHEQSPCTGGISYCGAGKNDKGVEQPASPAHQAESGGRKLHSRSERGQRDISSRYLSRATPTPWNSTLMGLRLCPPSPRIRHPEGSSSATSEVYTGECGFHGAESSVHTLPGTERDWKSQPGSLLPAQASDAFGVRAHAAGSCPSTCFQKLHVPE